MSRKLPFYLVAILSFIGVSQAISTTCNGAKHVNFNWYSDYSGAMKHAKRAKKMMLVYFTGPRSTSEKQFEQLISSDEQLWRDMGKFVLAKVSLDTNVVIDGQQQLLVEHPVFHELRKNPGIAIIDLRDSKSEHYHKVVTVFPFTKGYQINQERLSVLLNLPTGSLTQRTLVYAVRTHPDAPKSANGRFDPILVTATKKHSSHQARIHLQGHHNWNSRFHQINAKLSNGMTAQEVCAESWPGQTLIEAAEECVDSWRHSSGHWSAVRSNQTLFGYDMKRGRNGVWYATGIFARQR